MRIHSTRPVSVARSLLAGLFVWALVLHGLAAAHLGVADAGMRPADAGLCNAGGEGGPGHRPEQAASCCLPCRSGPSGALVWSAPAPSAALAPIRAAGVRRLPPLFDGAAAPFGRIGAQSPRAPPRSSRFSALS